MRITILLEPGYYENVCTEMLVEIVKNHVEIQIILLGVDNVIILHAIHSNQIQDMHYYIN